MSDRDQDGEGDRSPAWRARPVILAAIGAVAAMMIQQLLDRPIDYSRPVPSLATWRIALSIAIGTSTMALGFGIERVRAGWAAGFAVLAGLVAGFVFYWNGGDTGWAEFGDWRYASLFLSIAIAVPLFQTARDEGSWRFPYREVHGHAWNNVVLWCACWIFVGIVFLLAWLLAALFNLIGLHFVRDLLERHWFAAALAGAAFGGGLGLLRERDRIVRLLQRVVTAVLAVLAPVLGAGLLLFLVALPFTGLGALWAATKSTTPILLGCVVGALILANAVIGNAEDEEATNPVLRWGAIALGLAMLPLCVIAAIATGLRIAQHGFTPDRLWALIFVILASVYGVAYCVSLVLGRQGWAVWLRPANLRIAFGIVAMALFLATPIPGFNAISAADQVARLESGKVAPERFDWGALGFDFGEPGKAALKRLADSKNPAIARRAKQAVRANSRYEVADLDQTAKAVDDLAKRLRVLPAGTAVPDALKSQLTNWDACPESPNGCTLLYSPGATEAFLIKHGCIDDAVADAGQSAVISSGSPCVMHYRLDGVRWIALASGDMGRPDAAGRAALASGVSRGKIEIRIVPRRQVFVGGVPVGQPFE